MVYATVSATELSTPLNVVYDLNLGERLPLAELSNGMRNDLHSTKPRRHLPQTATNSETRLWKLQYLHNLTRRLQRRSSITLVFSLLVRFDKP